MLRASGIPFTLLRNGWYMENHTGSVRPALAAGAFIGSAGNGRIAGALHEDYAQAAVAVLTGTGHEGKIYELAGDALDDDGHALSQLIGRPTAPLSRAVERALA